MVSRSVITVSTTLMQEHTYPWWYNICLHPQLVASLRRTRNNCTLSPDLACQISDLRVSILAYVHWPEPVEISAQTAKCTLQPCELPASDGGINDLTKFLSLL